MQSLENITVLMDGIRKNVDKLASTNNALLVLIALGPERVERGRNAYRNYGGCCRSWRSCFLAQALNIQEDVARHSPEKMIAVASTLGLPVEIVEDFITTFDNDNPSMQTGELEVLCANYLELTDLSHRSLQREVEAQF